MNGPLIQELILRIAGTTGFAVFAAFFALTFSTPQWVEDFARDFITSEVRKRTSATIEQVPAMSAEGAIAGFVRELHRDNESEIGQLEARLEARMHELFANALAEVRNLSCECRQRVSDMLETGWRGRISTLLADNARAA